MNDSTRTILLTTIKLLLAGVVILPFWWTNRVLWVSELWGYVLLPGAVAAALPPQLWERVGPRRGPLTLFAVLLLIPPLLRAGAVAEHPVMSGLYAVTVLALLGMTLAFRRPVGVANVSLALGGVAVALVVANIGAGVVLEQLAAEAETAQAPPEPTAAPTETAAVLPSPTIVPSPTATPAPSPTPDPGAPPTPTPEPDRPVAGFGFLEWLEDNGEAPWTFRTGYGNRINSTAHAYMYDAQGELVYDTYVTYNGKGYRGPEAAYEKPDDVFRILILGDSFVEAIQVPFEETFYGQLQEEVRDETIQGKRIEIIPVGRTGWGTYNAVAYYQAEGYKFRPDLVISFFYINDVADNFPRFFYPDINNTNYEFVVEEGLVRAVDTNREPLPPNPARLLYNALPQRLQETNLARLFVRAGDPPLPVQTPGGPLTRIHPQYYIYVADPPVEGYAEGWERTAEAYQILARDVAADSGRLVVMPIFIGAEWVANVSGWFPEKTAGWRWDDTLPERRLGEIVEPLPADLVPLRPYYEAYANEAGDQVYDLIFLREDGHFNPRGHDWTTAAMLSWLESSGRLD